MYKIIAILFLFSLFSCSQSEQEIVKSGRNALDKGNLPQAKEILSKGIEAFPQSANLYNLRGVVYFKLKEYKAAEKDFTESLKNDSTSYKPYYNRGKVKSETNRDKEAIEDYDRALSLKKDEADIYNNRGFSYYNLGNLEKAEADFSSALSLRHSAVSYCNRGKVYLAANEAEKAVSDFKQCLLLDKDYPNAHYLFALSLFGTGAKDEGCEELKKAADAGNEKAKSEQKIRCNTPILPSL